MSTDAARDAAMQAALTGLTVEDAVGQLRRRDGLMARLGTEEGALKLDWVEAVARLLADPAQVEAVEADARAIRARGIRHIIWAGMGGSVLTVRVLRELGFCGGQGAQDEPAGFQRQSEAITIYPLDSTDPAALNAVVRAIAAAKRLEPPSAPNDGGAQDERVRAAYLREFLQGVMMVGVSMGMTSEEPITHLEWFAGLLERAGLAPKEHLLVMTLPGSYLDAFARERNAPSRPLQVDGGTGTGGRMSAPGTRVFLLPAALYLVGLADEPDEPGQLQSVLRLAWDEYNLELAASRPADHPFVRLAAALSAASRDDACRLLVSIPEGWQVFVSWLEQLMEESLGKGGKGVVVFDDQALNTAAPAFQPGGMLRVRVEAAPVPPATETPAGDRLFVLSQPALASTDPRRRLAALAASFLGWQLSMALYGYLHQIVFAGQPAVENYKARARTLRTEPDPLAIASRWQPARLAGTLTLLAPAGAIPAEHASSMQPGLAAALAHVLYEATRTAESPGTLHTPPLAYLDFTVNGAAGARLLALLDARLRALGNTLLGVPVKLRPAPAAYHSTEQSEMDGPPHLVSLRLVARDTEASLLGAYTNQFLHAQAVSTWQAMMQVGRPCCMLCVAGTLDSAYEPLAAVFSEVERHLRRLLSDDTARAPQIEESPA